ncbi:hypothetical protein [Aeoliella sp. SH292]|uniref:hypothetical protein n=1 Tax=Aeoliella sp. SH292 TaxID=3454464 RepID=UPI003F9CA3CB
MIGPVSLRDLVEKIDGFDGKLSVLRYFDQVLGAESKCFLTDLDEEGNPPAGLREFMDVWHIREVIHGKCKLAGLEKPDVSTKVQLLLDYVENDA